MKSPEAPDNDDCDPVSRCHHLLSSLSAAPSAVRSFRGRWSAAAAVGSRLSAALDEISNFASNPLAADLLLSLAQTLTKALFLVDDCRSLDPPAGKLRTQSDLAAACTALDQLAADADLLLRSGALLDPPATAAPAGTAEAKSLVTRLQIGNPASRIAALDALLYLLAADERNVAVAASQGAVLALVRLLECPGEAREKATEAIVRFSAVESCRPMITAECPALVGHLARVLESDGAAARDKACAVLQTLTLTRDGALAIGSRAGIAALLEVCHAGRLSAQAAAAGVLKNLTGLQDVRETLLEENGIAVLVGVLASGTSLARDNAVGCLCHLAAGDEAQSLQIEIFKEGTLDYLKIYLENGRGSDQNIAQAMELLRHLSSFSYIAEMIASAGFLPHIVIALDNADSVVRIGAAMAIAELGNTGRETKEIGEAIPRLVRMLEADNSDEKEAAVKALACLMEFSGNRKLFKKHERGLLSVVQLLDPLVRNVDKKHPVSVLLSVSQSRRCRKQIVAAGACGFLQGLMITEVEGAKKLSERLGRGKILGVFPRS